MDVTEIKMNFINDLKQDMKTLSHEFSSRLAHKISNEMAQKYQYVIDRFYSEYTPEHYTRHADRGMRPGLQKTFRKYYKNPHNTIYYGGIEISSDMMYNDYRDSKDEVLNSFLSGYHGRHSAGIESSLHPYKYMLKFRESLIKELGRPNNHIFEETKDEVKKKGLPYQIIKIL